MINAWLEQYWPFDPNLLPEKTYLVGGAVRDALMGKARDYLDLDLVLAQGSVTTAKAIAKQCQAGFVVLDEQRQIARIVFPQGTVDFAQQEGESLAADLHRRDFTINAIAYDFRGDTLHDPLGGVQDIQDRLIKMIKEENLADDPLRLLRAYRQGSQLGFKLDHTTAIAIKKLAPRIRAIAPERIQAELNYLISAPSGHQWLSQAIDLGLLEPWLGTVSSEQLTQLKYLDEILALAIVTPLGITSTIVDLAKLFILVGGDPQRVQGLKYSRLHMQAISTAQAALALFPQETAPTPSQQYFICQRSREHFPLTIILALIYNLNIGYLITEYLNPDSPIAHPPRWINGKDLIKELNVNPGPVIGELLTKIDLGCVEGKVRDRESALTYAAQLLARSTLEH
jgi:tRNA nucleotidyltransferase (CCA-adding enzyme)